MPTDNEYGDNLHKGAIPSTHRNARKLRDTETHAEQRLWQLLRNRQLKGIKFRKQHPLNKFVLDFYCHESKLVIELDGGIHSLETNQLLDLERTTLLKEWGIKVLRFRNEEVINEAEKVLAIIIKHI